MLASGQRQRRGDQVGRRRGPRFTGWQADELTGQALVVPRLHDRADGQVVDDQGGGQRPVTDQERVPDRVGQHAISLIPSGRTLMQGDHPVRMLVPQSQPEHLGEQRVVAVPPGADRLDQRVRAGQGGQNARGPVIAGQFDGSSGADMLQDAGAQQDFLDFRWLDVEHLVDQIAGHGAVFGHQFLDELVRVGMSAQGYRGQAQAGRPALGPPVQAFQRVGGQQAAVLVQQQSGLVEAEGQVASPDLGQLPGQPVTVQRQQRIHPRRDQQPQAGPRVPQHELKPLQCAGIGQQVQVIKDQRDRRVLGGQCYRQAQQEPVLSPCPARYGPQRLRDDDTGLAQRRHHIRPEHTRPVVELIQPDPGHRPGFGGRPQGRGPSSCPRREGRSRWSAGTTAYPRRSAR